MQRLHAGFEVRLHALGIGGRLLPVVANTDVNGKVAEEFPVILREDSVAEIVRVCIQASILAHAGWSSSEEVRKSVGGAGRGFTIRCREGECTVIVE
jgi:hypothetical protein